MQILCLSHHLIVINVIVKLNQRQNDYTYWDGKVFVQYMFGVVPCFWSTYWFKGETVFFLSELRLISCINDDVFRGCKRMQIGPKQIEILHFIM